MAYSGDFGNSAPDWDKHPGDNKIRVRDLKPGQKVRLVRLKLLNERDVGSMTISYAWLEVDGVIYRGVDLFGGDGYQYNLRRYRTEMYTWAKKNIPKGVYIKNLFDRMVWACS